MAKHGIVDWTFVEKNEIERPYGQNERHVKAFWSILGGIGHKVGVINWFVAFPPEALWALDYIKSTVLSLLPRFTSFV